MGKRNAESELTKDDGSDDDRDGSDDPGVRTEALRPKEGREIRGMPKRRGLGGPSTPSFGTPSASAPAPSAPAPSSLAANPFSTSFSFSSSSSASTARPPAFGTPEMNSNQFSLFGSKESMVTHGKYIDPKPLDRPLDLQPYQPPRATSGSTSASTPAPSFSFGSASAVPVVPATAAAAPTPAAPSKEFSFLSSTPATSFTSTPNPVPAPAMAPAASSGAKPPFAGFKFNNSATPASVAASPASAPTASTPAPAATRPPAPAHSSNGTAPSSSSFPPFASSPPVSVPSPAPAPTPAPTAVPSLRPTQSTAPPPGEVSYYTALRGLNASILSFLKQTVDADELVDLSSVLPALVAQYQTHLDEAATKAGWRPTPAASAPPPAAAAPATNGFKPAPSAPAPAAAAKPPAPPAAGGFALLKMPTPSSSATPTGFTPQLSGSTFSFSSPFPMFTASGGKKPSAEVNQLVKDVLDESAHTSAPTSSDTPSDTAPTGINGEGSAKKSNLFPISPSKPLHPTTPTSKTFAPSSTTVPASVESQVQQGKFTGGKVPNLPFGGAKPATPGAVASSPTASTMFGTPAGGSQGVGFAFGSASGPAGATTAATSTTTTKPTFSFGAPPSGGSSFSFPTTSTLSPATSGFSFGSTSASSAGSSMFPSTSESIFGKPATPAAAAPAPGAEGVETSGDGAGEGDETAPGATFDLAGAVGAGEENEITVVEIRAVLTGFNAETNHWDKIGTGVVRLKRSKDGTGKPRLLMRADGGGRVLLNSPLSSQPATAEKKRVKFTGYTSEGKPNLYLLSTKDESIASDLAEKIGAEAARE